MKKYQKFLSEIFHGFVVKFSVYLNRHVFVMYLVLFDSPDADQTPHLEPDLQPHYSLKAK